MMYEQSFFDPHYIPCSMYIIDSMDMEEILDMSVHHIGATGELDTYADELERAPDREIAVPAFTEKGIYIAATYLKFHTGCVVRLVSLTDKLMNGLHMKVLSLFN